MTIWRRAAAVSGAAAASAAVVGIVVAGVAGVDGAAARPTKTVVAAGLTSLPASGPAPEAADASRLPALRCRPAARACVDLRHRLAWLQADGDVVYGPVPTGTSLAGHRTPRGLFRVAWKAPHWVSSEYGIPMPWSVFFAAGGIAFHAGPLDEPSHGCVHLAPTAAHRFFDSLAVGDRVDVH